MLTLEQLIQQHKESRKALEIATQRHTSAQNALGEMLRQLTNYMDEQLKG